MRAIAIMNNKGGVGKTVTAINLADILANDYKQRVVLVDCDGQANLTGFFLPGEDMDAVTTADVLTGDCEQVWSDNLIPLGERLELLPSSSGLYDLDLSAIKDGVGAPERMIGFVSAAREDGDVDWMIFDCPPGYTLASVAALLSVDEVLIPVTADKFSIDGVLAVAQQAKKLTSTRPGLWVRALLTQVRRSDIVTEAEKVLEGMRVEVCRAKIRRTDTSKLITNDDGLLWLGTLKDQNGRYLLTPNPAEPKQLQLCVGPHVLPVKTYDNDTVPTTGTKVPMVIGDLNEGVVYWDRRSFSVKLSDTASVGTLNAFEQDLILWRGSLRDDCTKWDEDAFVNGYIDTAVVQAAG